jgi:hypothetical protein
MAGRNGIFTHAFSESSSKPYGKNGLPRRDTLVPENKSNSQLGQKGVAA